MDKIGAGKGREGSGELNGINAPRYAAVHARLALNGDFIAALDDGAHRLASDMIPAVVGHFQFR